MQPPQKLWHPTSSGFTTVASDGRRLWISMDFVDGEDAGSLLNRLPPPGGHACRAGNRRSSPPWVLPWTAPTARVCCIIAT